MFSLSRTLVPLIGLCFLVACQANPALSTTVVEAVATVPTNSPTLTSTTRPTNLSTPTPPPPPPTNSPIPTTTHPPTPMPTSTPTVTSTPTPIGPCSSRLPGDDLFAVVTQTYGLSRNFEPADLVMLEDYFGREITLGYPTQIRAVIVEPLVEMVGAMEAAGLRPFIISGYRSYAQQVIAREKWLHEEPERVNILSAPPGHSEHQLGTTVDFGSPELPEIVGQENIEFHTYFYQTSEGIWLAENAHRFGFTLSYPRAAQGVTGFFYEPWHYRYVGMEMATQLHEMALSLTEFQLANQPEPCIP